MAVLTIMILAAILGGTWFATKALEDIFRDEP